MDVEDPKVNPAFLPVGTIARVYAEKQPEYIPLPTLLTPKGWCISRWTLTEGERLRIAHGEDLYVSIQNGGNVNPMFITVGPTNWKSNE